MKRRLIAALFPVLCLGMVGVPGCADLTATIGASTQQPEPSPVPLLGTQDTVPSKFSIIGGMTVFKMSYSGESNFIVWLVNSSGEKKELLANEIGTFTGTKGVGLDKGDFVLEVQGEGSWSVTVEQPRPTSVEEKTSFSGTGQSLAGPFKLSGSKTFAMTHTGSSNFIVKILGSDGKLKDLLANKIGDYSGSKLGGSGSGTYYLDVDADGPWTIQIK